MQVKRKKGDSLLSSPAKPEAGSGELRSKRVSPGGKSETVPFFPRPDPAFCTHLVLQPPNWLGDVIMAQPAMRAFVTALKPTRLSLWGKPWLVDLIPFLNLPEAQYSPFMPEHADIAIMFPNSFRAAWMAWRAGSDRRIGFRAQWRRFLLTDAPAPRVNLLAQHHRDYYLDLAEQVDFIKKTGITVREREVILSCPETAISEGGEALRQQGLDPALTIAFAPGAQFGGAKRYPPESWASVAGWLSKQGYHILVVGTSAERTIGTQVTSRCSGPVWNASGETTLRRALQLLASSRCLLCNDSGLMHVAAGLQKPVVAVFGATDPARTSPSGSHVRFLYHPADCSPCLKRECSVPGQPCMGNISPDDVCDACIDLLAEDS